jgi:hypothetical protein
MLMPPRPSFLQAELATVATFARAQSASIGRRGFARPPRRLCRRLHLQSSKDVSRPSLELRAPQPVNAILTGNRNPGDARIGFWLMERRRFFPRDLGRRGLHRFEVAEQQDWPCSRN